MNTPGVNAPHANGLDWSRYFRPGADGVEIVGPLDECDAWRTLPDLDRRLAWSLLERVSRSAGGRNHRGPTPHEIVLSYRDLTRQTGESLYLIRRALDRLCARGLVALRRTTWGLHAVHIPAWKGTRA